MVAVPLGPERPFTPALKLLGDIPFKWPTEVSHRYGGDMLIMGLAVYWKFMSILSFSTGLFELLILSPNYCCESSRFNDYCSY